MVEDAKKKKILSMMKDWSQLPEELLHLISKHLEDEDNCFDVVHARSVSHQWRSAFPFPSCLLRPSYTLPAFADSPLKSKDLCTFEKVPLFLHRVRAPTAADFPFEYFLGGVRQDNSEDRIDQLPPSPLQCSMKVDILGSDPVLLNMVDCQSLSLGYQYKMIGWDPEDCRIDYRGMAFLPLNNEGGGGGEFVVIVNYNNNLFLLRSAEMRWMRLKDTSYAPCSDLVAFRGRFYAAFLDGDIFVYDPHSMKRTPLMPSQRLCSRNYLIASGNDELFLVEKFNPFPEDDEVIDFNQSACRVSKLDEEAGKWVEITDLGDLVLFIGYYGNVCCSAKKLPDGCGLSGNSILFANEGGGVIFAHKYGVHTGRGEDNLNLWRLSRDKQVMIKLNISL